MTVSLPKPDRSNLVIHYDESFANFAMYYGFRDPTGLKRICEKIEQMLPELLRKYQRRGGRPTKDRLRLVVWLENQAPYGDVGETFSADVRVSLEHVDA